MIQSESHRFLKAKPVGANGFSYFLSIVVKASYAR